MEKIILFEEVKKVLGILNSSYKGLCITDHRGKITFCNDVALQISGLEKEEIKGKYLIDLVKEKIVPQKQYKSVLEAGEDEISVVRFYNGVTGLLLRTQVFSDEGELKEEVFNLCDVTKVMRIYESLKEMGQDIVMSQRKMLRIVRHIEEEEDHFIAQSEVMQGIKRLADKIAKVKTPVLIQGESGVGKDVLAHYIHGLGSKAEPRPFVQINCSAIPNSLLESELFGYEPGAFTGASKTGKQGLFELANGGTLFLDEIGCIPFSTQIKLLNVLQRGFVYRLGGTSTIKINTRVIAATNSNLQEMVAEKKFRMDLYYRLNVLSLDVPSLRQRREDIEPLLYYFLNKKNEEYGLNMRIDPCLLNVLYNYDWPGNIRELKNLVERMVVLAEDNVISEKHLPGYIKDKVADEHPLVVPEHLNTYVLKTLLSTAEEEIIKKALEEFGSMRKAAKQLGIDLSTLVRKKKKYGI